MAEKKKQTKCDCGCCERSVFPICFLACIMTALLVALGFAAGLTATVGYELNNDYVIRSSGQFVREVDGGDTGKIIRISAPALIDFYASGQTGFIYASVSNCVECSDFTTNLTNIAAEKGVTDMVFRYVYPLQPDNFDKYISEVTIANETGPVLIYVRDGKIYDRLDEPNSELAISNFLTKYK